MITVQVLQEGNHDEDEVKHNERVADPLQIELTEESGHQHAGDECVHDVGDCPLHRIRSSMRTDGALS